MKLAMIAEAWINIAEGDPELQAMAKGRLEICDLCPLKRQMTPAGKFIVKLLNHENSIYYCGSCGCPLASVTMHPAYACPEGHWKAVIDAYY